jgi:Uma2 family endonuclease
MAQAKVWTLAELHNLPDDGNRYELLHGELFVTPAPSFDHETIIARLHAVLVQFVMVHETGFVYSGNSVIHWSGSELIPDLLVRQSAARNTEWASAPVPILVVEVLSPATRKRDQEYKRRFYLDEVGVPEYWAVHPDRRSITVMRRDGSSESRHDRLTWSPPGIGARLDIALVDVFGPPEHQ